MQSSRNRGRIGSRGRLVLAVSLPRLARHAAEVLAWLQRYEPAKFVEQARELALIPGAEGLAALAHFSPEARRNVLDRVELAEEERSPLIEVVSRLGDVTDPSSPAAALVQAFPVAARVESDIEEDEQKATRTMEEPREPLHEEPLAQDAFSALAATVESWQDEAAAMEALAILARVAARGGLPLPVDFWRRALGRLEPLPEPRRLTTLNYLAYVLSSRGEHQTSLAIWQRLLPLWDEVGDVQGKAATLHNMAGVIAQQGDVKRALELWNQSLTLKEQIGDVQGKAATLANMAWLAGKQGNHERERQLNLEAANSLASIRAWLDLVTVLGNLGASDDPDAAAFVAQALWLSVRVEVPVDDAVPLAAALIEKLGPDSESAPLVATTGMFLAQVRGEGHPKQGEMQQLSARMLTACAAARKIQNEKLTDWITREKLNDPRYFLPALDRALETIVAEDGWLFDRQLFGTIP